jgi:nicotinate dehydrogenase subunit A
MTAMTFTVNGRQVEVDVSPEASLLSVLRHEVGLSGPKFGCGMGQCGACFVRLDGSVVPSCDTPMWSATGRDVVTVEGLAHDGRLHPVQQAILDQQAAQCGYCIAGIVVSASTLLERVPSPSREEVVDVLDRHLCRCGSQHRIINAVLQAGRRRDG